MMVEYIDRETLLERAEYDNNYRLIIPAEVIKACPATNVVPVVRCKDCKYAYYYNEEGYHGFVCNGYFQYADVESNDFCSYGEMRNNYE